MEEEKKIIIKNNIEYDFTRLKNYTLLFDADGTAHIDNHYWIFVNDETEFYQVWGGIKAKKVIFETLKDGTIHYQWENSTGLHHCKVKPDLLTQNVGKYYLIATLTKE